MKRIFKGISLVLLSMFSSLFFVGCNEGEKADEDDLVIWANLIDSEIEEFQKIAYEWSKESGRDVFIYVTSATGADFIKTDDRAKPDIFLGVSAEDTGRLVKANSVEVIPEEYVDKNEYVSEDLVQATSIDGVQYGVPITAETVVLYYNKDVVDTVPDTMEDLIRVGKEKGFKFEANSYFFSYGIVLSQGGYIYKNNNGSFDYKDIGTNTSESISGLQYLQNIFTKEDTFLPGTTDMMAAGSFEAGDIAYYIGEAGRVRTFNDRNVNFGIAKIPTVNGKEFKPYKYVKMASISSCSDKKDEAWDLLSKLLEKSDEIFMESGPYAPTFKESLESDTYKNSQYASVLYEQNMTSEILPNIIENEAINYVVNGYLEKLILGKITAEECGKSMETDIKQTIQDLLVYDD